MLKSKTQCKAIKRKGTFCACTFSTFIKVQLSHPCCPIWLKKKEEANQEPNSGGYSAKSTNQGDTIYVANTMDGARKETEKQAGGESMKN